MESTYGRIRRKIAHYDNVAQLAPGARRYAPAIGKESVDEWQLKCQKPHCTNFHIRVI